MSWMIDWIRNRTALWGPTFIADPPPPPRSWYARNLVTAATEQIGRGEQGKNNAGPDIDRYRNGGPGGAWCAAFVSWCLEEAANRNPAPLRVPKRSHGAKRLFANVLKVGVQVEQPAPGDIVLWHRGAKNAATGHIGIVSRVDGNAFYSIEGNKGGFPSKVREYGHELGEALLLGFARLP